MEFINEIPVSIEDIKCLRKEGFGYIEARQALRYCNNNHDAALKLLNSIHPTIA